MKTLLILTALFAAASLQAAPPEKPAAAPKAEFVIRFSAHDDETDPAKMSFQLTSSDPRIQSGFLKLNDTIPNTNLTLKSYKYKDRRNTATGVLEEASELTLINVATKKTVVLVFNKPTDVAAADAPAKPKP